MDRRTAATAAAGRRHGEPARNETTTNPQAEPWGQEWNDGPFGEESGRLARLESPTKTTATAAPAYRETGPVKPTGTQTQLLQVKTLPPPSKLI